MQDRPSAPELLEAVAAFLREEVASSLQGRKRFHALVAANACRMVAREIELSAGQLEREYADLCSLLELKEPSGAKSESASYDRVRELNFELCEHIDAGWADEEPRRSRLIRYLQARVADKLAVSNPKLLEPRRPRRR